MAKIVELPDGREAEFPDDMSNDAIGEVLRKQFAASPAPEQPAANTIGQEAGRQLGLTGRALVSAAASPVTLIGDTIGKGINALTGRETITPYSRQLHRALTAMGLPEPQRPIEQFTQGMAESAPAFALPASLPAQVLGNAAINSAMAPQGNEGSAAAWGAAGGAVVPALGGALRAAGKGAAHVLGGTTGAGAESVRQAFRNGPGFVENMRGTVAPGEVVEQARAGIQNMRSKMQETYRNDKVVWAASQKPLDIAPVIDTYTRLTASFGHEGFAKIGPSETKVLNEMNDVFTNFALNPKWHTTEGFDALKQRLQAIYPESPQMRQAQRAVSTMANSVKDSIKAQAPNYADAMQGYWRASQHLDEIERSLSLGDKATTDTALRKLQSLMRNNASSNYGQRLESAEMLATQGGEDVLPAVAGQAMNDWLPRGIARGVSASMVPAGVFSGGMGIPAAIGTGIVQSPRIVGETARGLGMVVNNENARAVVEALRRGVPAASRPQRDDQ